MQILYPQFESGCRLVILNYNLVFNIIIKYHCNLKRECGEIGRHDGLKIHCLVISVRVQVPPFPSKVKIKAKKTIFEFHYKKLNKVRYKNNLESFFNI